MRPAPSEETMKWVLLLGLVVGLAYGRTIFDYERDGLENKQKGFPGKSVSGQYEWRAPDGKVTEVSYVADHLGFRLVEDPEYQEPSEPSQPSSPSESTSQANTKEAKAVIVGGEEEEEEEEEEEGEEYEAEGREAEEQDGEEEEEEESGQSKSPEEKKEKTEGEQSEKVIEDRTAEDDAAETEKVDATEAKNKKEETETKEDENTGKGLSQSSERATEETDQTEDTDRSGLPTDSVVATEVKTTEETLPEAVQTPALVPVKVESTVAEEPVYVEPSIAAGTPIIAIAESAPAVEPMVAPVQGDTSFSTFETPVSSDDVVVVGVSYDREENYPVAVPIAKELSSDPATSPAVEIAPVQEPIVSFPLAEPLQQPAVEVTPVLSENPFSVSVSVDRDFETPVERIIAVESPTLPSQSSFVFSESPQIAPLFEFQGASSGLSPVPVNAAPQQFQIFELVQQAPVPSSDQITPSALPQIQVFQLDSSFRPVARTLETDPIAEVNPSVVFVGEVSDADVTLGSGSFADSTNIKSYPAVEIEGPQHRFQVKSGRSMDSAPVQVVKELDPFTDLYFIPESFKMSEPKPSQSSVHLVEVEASAPSNEMIIKAKSLSQPNEIENIESSAASTNYLDKPVFVLTAPAADSSNIFPDYSVDYIQPMTSEADFFQAPGSISGAVQYAQVPAAVFGNQEAVASPRIAEVDTQSAYADDLTILSASPDTPASSTSPAREVTLVAYAEKPKERSEDVVLTDASAPLAKKRSSSQVPPLLPPLMKMSRILNTGI